MGLFSGSAPRVSNPEREEMVRAWGEHARAAGHSPNAEWAALTDPPFPPRARKYRAALRGSWVACNFPGCGWFRWRDPAGVHDRVK